MPKFRPRTTHSTPSPLVLALFSSAAKLRGKSAFLGSNGGGSHVHRNDPKLLSIGHQLTQWWFALRNKKQSRGLFPWSPHPHLTRLGNLDLLPKCCHELRVLTAAQESSAKICSSGRQGTCPPGILIPRDARASPARRASPREAGLAGLPEPSTEPTWCCRIGFWPHSHSQSASYVSYPQNCLPRGPSYRRENWGLERKSSLALRWWHRAWCPSPLTPRLNTRWKGLSSASGRGNLTVKLPQEVSSRGRASPGWAKVGAEVSVRAPDETLSNPAREAAPPPRAGAAETRSRVPEPRQPENLAPGPHKPRARDRAHSPRAAR